MESHNLRAFYSGEGHERHSVAPKVFSRPLRRPRLRFSNAELRFWAAHGNDCLHKDNVESARGTRSVNPPHPRTISLACQFCTPKHHQAETQECHLVGAILVIPLGKYSFREGKPVTTVGHLGAGPPDLLSGPLDFSQSQVESCSRLCGMPLPWRLAQENGGFYGVLPGLGLCVGVPPNLFKAPPNKKNPWLRGWGAVLSSALDPWPVCGAGEGV